MMLWLAETRTKSVVCDQIRSQTRTTDLVPLLCDMIETKKHGACHASNEGICFWTEFAEEISSLAEENVRVKASQIRE